MNRLSLSLFISLLLLNTSCSKKEVTLKEHQEEKKVETAVSSEATTSDFSGIDVDSLEQKTSEEQLANLSAQQIEEQFITPFANKILSEEFLEKNKATSTTKTSRLLRLVNRAFLTAYSKDKSWQQSAAALNYIKDFSEIALSYCDEKLQNCKFQNFLRKDVNSSRIIELKIVQLDQQLTKKYPNRCQTKNCKSDQDREYLTSLKVYYDLLFVTYGLLGGRKSTQLEFLYLKRAQEYNYFYLNILASERKVSVDQLTLKEIGSNEKVSNLGNIFENIIDYHNALDPTSAEFKQFVDNFNPWNFSQLRASPLKRGIERMFQFASQHFLYNKDGSLTKSFTKSIEDYQRSDKFLDEKPHFQKFKSLSKKAPYLFSNLGINSSSYHLENLKNEYFFVIDRSYNQHLQKSEVDQFLKNIKIEHDQLAKVYSQYMRLEVLHLMQETKEEIQKIYLSNNQNAQSIFTTIVDEAEGSLAQRWTRLLKSLENTFLLLDPHFSQTEKSLKSYHEMSQIRSTIRKNIKYISVYPSMVSLGLSLADLEVPVKTKFGRQEKEVDSTEVIDQLIAGEVEPWFNFGNDNLKLKKGQMLWAFTFGLLSQNFPSGAEKASIYFKKLFKYALSPMTKKIKKATEDFSKYLENNPDVQRFKTFCTKPESFIAYINKYDDILNYSFIGNDVLGPLGKVSRVYDRPPETGFDFWTKTINEYDIKLRFFRTLVANFSSQNQANSPQFDELTKSIKMELKKYDTIRKKLFSKLAVHTKNISKCFYRALQAEREIQRAQLRAEISYFKVVYQAFKNADNLSNNQEKNQQIRDEIEKVYGELLGHKDRVIQYPTYFLSQYEIRERFSQRAESGINVEGLQSGHRLEFAIGDSVLQMPSLDIQVTRPANLKDQDFFNATDKSITFDPNQSLDDFLRNIFQNYYGPSEGSIVKYLYQFTKKNLLIKRESTYLRLYKLEEIDIFPEDQSLLWQTSSCSSQKKGNCQFKLNANDLLEELVSLREALSFKSTERDIYHLVNQENWLEKDEMDGFLIKADERLPLLYSPMQRLLNEYSHELNLDEGLYARDSSKIASSFSGAGFLLFPTRKYICKNTFNQYNSAHRKYVRLLENFEKALSKVETQGSIAKRITEISLDLKISSSAEKVELIPYQETMTSHLVKSNSLGEYKKRIRRFHSDSNSFFENNRHLNYCTVD